MAGAQLGPPLWDSRTVDVIFPLCKVEQFASHAAIEGHIPRGFSSATTNFSIINKINQKVFVVDDETKEKKCSLLGRANQFAGHIANDTIENSPETSHLIITDFVKLSVILILRLKHIFLQHYIIYLSRTIKITDNLTT